MSLKMDIGQQFIWASIRSVLPPGTRLTCVTRDSQHQLDIIIRYAKKEGYTFEHEPSLRERAIWLAALTFLREKHYKIAEPGRSMHEKGLAYDFSGPDLQKIYDSIATAAKTGRIRLVNKHNNLILEKSNRCVHAEIEGVRVDSNVFAIGIA